MSSSSVTFITLKYANMKLTSEFYPDSNVTLGDNQASGVSMKMKLFYADLIYLK